MKELWRPSEAWHYDRREETIGEGVVEVPELKESWREAKAWHHVGSQLLKRTHERLVVKVYPLAKPLAFLKCQHHVMATKEQQQLWRGASLSLGDKLCVLLRAELETWLRPVGAQRIVGEFQTSDTKLVHSRILVLL